MPESTCGNFFFLQVGVEAEGSGPVWPLDVGSGSGDIVGNEDLLRVSMRGAGGWCWALQRAGCGVRQTMTVDWPLGDCFLASVGIIMHSPLLFTHFSQGRVWICIELFLFSTLPSSFPWKLFLSPSQQVCSLAFASTQGFHTPLHL